MLLTVLFTFSGKGLNRDGEQEAVYLFEKNITRGNNNDGDDGCDKAREKMGLPAKN